MKLLVNGMVLTKDVKFQGNNVKGARHILSFEKHMEDSPKLKILKTLLTGALNVPKYHPKSTSVIDHVLNFTCEGDLVSFRNYQIFREAVNKETDKLKLYEIGPRFLMNPQVILDGIMGGEVLYRS
jgi:ribosome biogenesis protein BRX1